jgi:anti-sigma B factor antagonist
MRCKNRTRPPSGRGHSHLRTMRLWRNSNVGDQESIDTEGVRIIIEQKPSETIVAVAGRVTIDSSPCLRSVVFRQIQKCRGAVIVIDMQGVIYLDISGIATLLEALRLAQQLSVKLRLERIRPEVRMIAEITELAEIFAAAGSEVRFS